MLFTNPTSTLPNINYIGMNKEMVIEQLLKDSVIDKKTGNILMAAPYGNFIQLQKKEDIKKNTYAMEQQIWDVNFIYTKNCIKGGYYFFRITFNKDGLVETQKKLFASDGLFGL